MSPWDGVSREGVEGGEGGHRLTLCFGPYLVPGGRRELGVWVAGTDRLAMRAWSCVNAASLAGSGALWNADNR